MSNLSYRRVLEGRIRALRPEGLPRFSRGFFPYGLTGLPVRPLFFQAPARYRSTNQEETVARIGKVSLDYAAPEEALKQFVSVFYDFRADLPRFEDQERADLAQLRFKLSPGASHYRFVDGHVQVGPDIQLLGPTTGVTHSSADGPIDVFGAGLLPGGWGAITGIDASSVVNRVIDATELFGPGLHEVADQLRAAATTAERAAIGNELVRHLVDRDRAHSDWFTRTVDAWLSSHPSPEVDTLVAETRLSRRQVERYCKRFYGSPPKLLARKYRALRAAVALAKGEATTHDLLDRGFYDQSHCIREIKRFTGVTPQRIAHELPELTRLTLKRTEFAGQVAALVTET